jgi:hypothetical protein
MLNNANEMRGISRPCLSLGGCCLSGNGCQVAAPATEPATGMDWDGLSPIPSDSNETATSRTRLGLKEVGAVSTKVGPNLQTKDQWEQQQALDQPEDAGLTRKLMIGRNCQRPETSPRRGYR